MKRLWSLLLALGLIALGTVSAQEPAPRIKESVLKRIGPIVPLAQADLRPSAWVDCCPGECGDTLSSKGVMLVRYISVYVYNPGNAASNPATGKVEFFNVLTNSNVTLPFTVGAVAAKGWGTVTPSRMNGPYLVKTGLGVKVSVTFTGGGVTAPKTNTNTQKECSTII